MGNWKDPDIRNHVSGDITRLRYGAFLSNIVFYNESANSYPPYKLKDLYNQQSLLYKSVEQEKRARFMEKLAEEAPLYTFAATSNYKAMQDSYYAISHVYLYQIILHINNIWTMLDYNDENIPKVLVPTKSNITDLFRALKYDLQFSNAKELTTQQDINEAIDRVINNAQFDCALKYIIKEKLYLNDNDVARRLGSPLIRTYLNTELSKLINDAATIDDELLIKTLNKMLRKLKIYIRDARENHKEHTYQK